ncbi:MAG: hypothetical protein NC092_13525 [Butyrivibrio sp.]|nr:hypothetical protein [Muribaculum sp.]MCM1553692.1 hypothetical protein [Butyrivibrio sp.]
MRRKGFLLLTGLLAAVTLSACGADPELQQFKKDMDSFCDSVAELHESINNIDAEAANASALALDYLDNLDIQFQKFAELDFPEEYDYLEELADEAGEYMSEAVQSYHEAFADGGYDESTGDYARENSARALKRLQVILDILHGENPTEDTPQAN